MTFTGEVHARLLQAPNDESALTVYEVTFCPGARTYWHAHPLGQGLYITDGQARIQIDGQPAANYDPGDYVWIPPRTRHWHGATPDKPMTHVAMQEAAPNGTTVTWGEAVAEPTYQHLDGLNDKDNN